MALVRDLVNTPAGDLGPAELEQAVRQVAEQVEAGSARHVRQRPRRGLSANRGCRRGRHRRPCAALDRAGMGPPGPSARRDHRQGRLLRQRRTRPKAGERNAADEEGHGRLGPRPRAGEADPEERLPVRLHLLIPAVENAVSGAAYRPGDIVKSRQGLHVEIDNTDAEGRLILADALTKAGENEPELIVDFATLTGAARIALGPDLPPCSRTTTTLPTNSPQAGKDVADPSWRMPLWDAYDDMLKSDIADIVNSAGSPMAGAVVGGHVPQAFRAEGHGLGSFRYVCVAGQSKTGASEGR